jgi:tetratricopeptide (TPR) repeat protein
LIWYALLPRWYGRDGTEPRIDYEKRRIIAFSPEGMFSVDFAGFSPSTSTSDVAKRQQARKLAYDRLREGVRMASLGQLEESLANTKQASIFAAAAGDPLLREWISRVHARTLVSAGRFAEGERLFEEIAARVEVASDAACDAARAFHLEGELQRAAGWYVRGLGKGADPHGGRLKYEYLEGAVLAYGELGQWDDALRVIDSFMSAYPPDVHWIGNVYRQYVQWRTTGRVEAVSADGSAPDLIRYWELEFRYSGDSPDWPALLQSVEKELRRTSSDPSLLLSLKAELLARVFRATESSDTITRAYTLARAARLTDTGVRAHFDIVQERYDRLAAHKP